MWSEKKAIDGLPGTGLLQMAGWWFYSLIQGQLEEHEAFWGNIMNVDMYNIEFAVYISDILTETSEGNCLYRHGSQKSKRYWTQEFGSHCMAVGTKRV